MVGVPGRSGGCATCRRKKKGCDKQTPFCGQCLQSGVVCEGYGRKNLVWVNSTDGENRKYTKSSSTGSSPREGSPSITLNESLMVATRADRYVGLFLAAFLPNGRLFSLQASQISSAGWIRHHDGLCRSEKTLRLITLAHGLSMLATRDDNIQLKVKGSQAHCMALQEMQRAVQDPQRAVGDGLLAAVRLFRFYEILYGAEPNGQDRANPRPQIEGYYAHTDGEMAMFMNRGPHRKWSQAGRYLLASGRIVSFILGVCRRMRSPFDTNQWLTAPWMDTVKTPLDKLTDIMVQTPRLLEDLDVIRATPVNRRTPREWRLLLDRCSEIEESILAWNTSMRHDLQTYDYTYAGSPLPVPEVDRGFAVLHLCFFYWSCSVLLYTTIHIITTEANQDGCLTNSSPIPFALHGFPNYQNERNPTLHAHRILHALPLSYKPHAGGYAALSSTFPLGMSLRYLVVAHLFPHEGDNAGPRDEFLQKTVSQPFMGAYTPRFIDHLFKVDAPVECLRNMTGWHGMELRAKTWWFGSTENC